MNATGCELRDLSECCWNSRVTKGVVALSTSELQSPNDRQSPLPRVAVSYKGREGGTLACPLLFDPQHTALPVFFWTAHMWLWPAVSCVTFPSDGGTVVCPLLFDPQQAALPVDFWIAHVWESPAASCVTFPSDGGTLAFPQPRLPQQKALPDRKSVV